MTIAYEKITAEIIELLESSQSEWELPWRRVGFNGAARNAVGGNVYQGINHLVLGLQCWKHGYQHNLWLTFKQAKKLGGYVRKGQKATPVLFFKLLEQRDDETGDVKQVPCPRVYYVFNISQCDGLQVVTPQTEHHATEGTDILAWAQGLATIELGGDRACYIPSLDKIQMPHRSQFHSDDGFHATLLHEMTHWTKNRVGRKADDYAFEELVAELGSVFLCEHFGIRYELEHHASYLKSWMKALKDDKRYIVKAARLAEQAFSSLVEPGEAQLKAA
ncbi:MAG: ArdC family protein [Pseudomonadales bacterium]